MAWDAYVYIYTYIMCSSLSSIRYPACPREIPGQELAFGWFLAIISLERRPDIAVEFPV